MKYVCNYYVFRHSQVSLFLLTVDVQLYVRLVQVSHITRMNY